MNALINPLKEIFGYQSFQPGQKEIINDIMNGNDCLGILPTGSGKSLCYQLPAILLPGVTVVVSPLISLMIDQVRQIKAYYFKEVAAIHSFHHKSDQQSILKRLSTYKIIFISPELLQQKEVLQYFKDVDVSLFCIDEAHCISQWGYDFRPDYLRLQSVVSELGNPTVLALTGTATEQVQQDIIQKINRPKMIKHVYSMERTNISFIIHEVSGNEQEKRKTLTNQMSLIQLPAVIYFSSRRTAEQMTVHLITQLSSNRIAFYHAGMEAHDRLKVQQQFMNDQLDIICCTSAFGMGINKQNIRTVIHYHLPTQLESFMQENGRAGRDGKDSVSILFYKKGDKNLPLSIIENELPNIDELTYVMNKLVELHRLNKSLPRQKIHIEDQFQISETKWRFLYYQFEVHGIIQNDQIQYEEMIWKDTLEKISTFCSNRLQEKRRKVNEMDNWATTKTCLRETLYTPFQNKVIKKTDKCCSNCGYSLSASDVNVYNHNEAKKNWQLQLKSLLLLEDVTYEK